MFDVTNVIISIVGVIFAVMVYVIFPLIKSKVTNEQWESICNYALAGVQAAEILIGAGNGNLRRPKITLSSSVRRTASRLTPIQSRSPLRMPGRRWGWTKNKLSVKRNRPLCK